MSQEALLAKHLILCVWSKTAVFWAVTVKNVVFLDMTPCGYSKKDRRIGGTYHFHGKG
jgi:hypothetical protein